MSDARWGDPREYDARDLGYEWPRVGDAMRWGLVGRNAAALAYGPRVPRAELQVFSIEQAQAFLEAVKGERLEAFFCTAIATGLRLGELLGLRWSDVDLDAGC